MFNSIVESVLNEITANDAYAKYYSELPKEEFFGLANMYGKFDNLLRMVMDSIRDGYNTFGDGRTFVEKFIKAENNVRMAFLRSFKIGEFSNLDEADAYLDMLTNNGCESEKSLYTNGLIVMSDDKESTITCTTTYAANSHYYGNTRWCTASDRNGDYDGWAMFLNYVFGQGVMAAYQRDELDFDTIQYCLVQYVDHETGKSYQFQFDRSCAIGMMCDEQDVQIEKLSDPPYEIVNFMLQFMRNYIKQCFAATAENLEKEAWYRLNKETFELKKAMAFKKRSIVLKKKLTEKTLKLNTKKADFVTSKFNEVVNSNLLYNYQFVKEIADKSFEIMKVWDSYSFTPTEEYIQEAEKFFLNHGYLYTKRSRTDNINGITYYVMFPIIGLIKRVNVDHEKSEVSLKDLFEPWFYHENVVFDENGHETYEEIRTHGGVCVFVDQRAECVISVVCAERCYGIEKIVDFSYNKESRDLVVLNIVPTKQDTLKHIIYNVKTGQKLDASGCVFDKRYVNGNQKYDMPPGYIMLGSELYSSAGGMVSLISLSDLTLIGKFYGNRLVNNQGYFLYSNEVGGYLVTNDKVINLNYKKEIPGMFTGFLSSDKRYFGILSNSLGIDIYDLQLSKFVYENVNDFGEVNNDGFEVMATNSDGTENKIFMMYNANKKLT